MYVTKPLTISENRNRRRDAGFCASCAHILTS